MIPRVGDVNRARGEDCVLGGKGSNVSGVLAQLGCESVALGFVAGETGAWLERGLLAIGAVMCGTNPVMGIINTAISTWLNSMGDTSRVLMGAIVAALMGIDMGGPLNKATYVFGTAALASGNYEIMASVMVGGMVPPIVIALSTTFFPKKWTADERRNGIINYVMGLCFVTEGAIPYAATDPLRVIPSCAIGSALAGALSMVFGCALRAPHGGIFVFPVVEHAPLYLVALAAGSMVGALLLSVLKKTKTEEA